MDADIKFEDASKLVQDIADLNLAYANENTRISDSTVNFRTTCDPASMEFSDTNRRDGRLSGDVFVKVRGKYELDKALKHDHENMGRRYIEVFEANEDEVVRSTVHQVKKDGTVRLRGLPYDVKKADIADFFWGLEIVPEGIGLLLDHRGDPNGEAFVQFVSLDDADKAIEKSGGKIGHRYIEVFPSSLAEANEKIKQLSAGYGGYASYTPRGRDIGWNGRDMNPRDFDRYRNRSRERSWDRGYGRDYGYNSSSYGPRDGPYHSNFGYDNSGFRTDYDFYSQRRDGHHRNGGDRNERTTRHTVRMRGLPFKASESDIMDFFRPLHPVAARIEMQRGGRPSGHAEADFACHDDAIEAMKRDREKMGSRYIELFLHSEAR